jgi:hypothetical protein
MARPRMCGAAAGGESIGPNGLAEPRGGPRRVPLSPQVADAETGH